MVATRGLFLASLLALALAKPMGRSLKLHESRAGVPDGFSLSGSASPDATLKLRIALVQSNLPELERQLYDVSTPSSANYGKHLSKSEVQQLVAPKPESVDAVNAWLSENDITAKSVSATGDWLSFEVPVSKANDLFDADFSVFTHDNTGLEAIRTLSYSIPAELQGHLDLVHPTVTFPNPNAHLPTFKAPVKRSVHESRSAADVPASCAKSTTPACLQALYGISSDPAGSSGGIGVTGFIGQYANTDDLETFLAKYRSDIDPEPPFGGPTFTTQTLDGGSNPQDGKDAGAEANLDIQYTVGLATNVPVTFISVGNDNQDGDLEGFLDVINFLLAEDQPPAVLTTSYGQNEDTISQNLANNLCNAYAQLGARGVSILFASGDGGVSGSQSGKCSTFVPTFPSGCPFLTSVGATTGIAPERAASFSSGGFSNYFGAPDYQTSSINSYLSELGSTNSGKYNASGRGYPDVSTQGTDFEVVIDGEIQALDGTSCASPTFASVIALINDNLAAANLSPLGFLNPFLYSVGASTFTDITSGSNPGCNTNGFPAEKGWDPVTGLGTPQYFALASAATNAKLQAQ